MFNNEINELAESLYDYFSKFDRHILSPAEIRAKDKNESLEELKEQLSYPRTIDDIVTDIEDLTATYDESLCGEGMSLIVDLKDFQTELAEKQKIRMADKYEVVHAIHVGHKEVVFMKDNNNKNEPYGVAYCSTDNPFNAYQYTEVMVGDDYMELMNLFSERLGEQIKEVEKERQEKNIPDAVIGYEHCIPNSERDDYTNQIIVIKASCLRPEYRTADNQLCLAEHGNGCSPDASGRAVYTKNIYSGKGNRWNRVDVLGIIKPDCIPDWAKEKVDKIRSERATPPQKKSKETVR